MSRQPAKLSGKKDPTWSQQEQEVLYPFKAAWRAADSKGRKTLLSDHIMIAFFRLHPELVGFERDKHKTKVRAWFQNNVRKPKKEGKYLLLPRASMAKVVLHEKKAEIEDTLRKITNPDVVAGHPQFLGGLSRAKKIVLDSLGPDEMERLKEVQEKWESEGWPVDVQRRYVLWIWKTCFNGPVLGPAREATRRAAILSESMDRLRWRHMGLRPMTFVAYEDTNGELGMEFYDWNQKLGGGAEKLPVFKETYAAAVQGMLTALWSYLQDIAKAAGQESGAATEKTHGRARKRPLPSMAISPTGCPILPPICEEEGSLQYKKDLLRSFLISHYRLATGQAKRIPPFKALALNNKAWANKEYWPVDINIQDPSRMNEPELVQTLQFYRQRALEMPDNVFRWRRVETGRRGFGSQISAPYPPPVIKAAALTTTNDVPVNVAAVAAAAAGTTPAAVATTAANAPHSVAAVATTTANAPHPTATGESSTADGTEAPLHMHHLRALSPSAAVTASGLAPPASLPCPPWQTSSESFQSNIVVSTNVIPTVPVVPTYTRIRPGGDQESGLYIESIGNRTETPWQTTPAFEEKLTFNSAHSGPVYTDTQNDGAAFQPIILDGGYQWPSVDHRIAPCSEPLPQMLFDQTTYAPPTDLSYWGHWMSTPPSDSLDTTQRPSSTFTGYKFSYDLDNPKLSSFITPQLPYSHLSEIPQALHVASITEQVSEKQPHASPDTMSAPSGAPTTAPSIPQRATAPLIHPSTAPAQMPATAPSHPSRLAPSKDLPAASSPTKPLVPVMTGPSVVNIQPDQDIKQKKIPHPYTGPPRDFDSGMELRAKRLKKRQHGGDESDEKVKRPKKKKKESENPTVGNSSAALGQDDTNGRPKRHIRLTEKAAYVPVKS